MSQYLSNIGEHDRALVAGQRAVALAAALGDLSLQIETRQLLGQVYHALGATLGHGVLRAGCSVHPQRSSV